MPLKEGGGDGGGDGGRETANSLVPQPDRHASSSAISHYPNVGEARPGRDAERDQFPSGTIRTRPITSDSNTNFEPLLPTPTTQSLPPVSGSTAVRDNGIRQSYVPPPRQPTLAPRNTYVSPYLEESLARANRISARSFTSPHSMAIPPHNPYQHRARSDLPIYRELTPMPPLIPMPPPIQPPSRFNPFRTLLDIQNPTEDSRAGADEPTEPRAGQSGSGQPSYPCPLFFTISTIGMDDRIEDCSHCSSSLPALFDHLSEHRAMVVPGGFGCKRRTHDSCFQTFQTLADLRSHQYHMHRRLFYRNVCTKPSVRRPEEQCNESFDNQWALEEHKKIEHPDSYQHDHFPFECHKPSSSTSTGVCHERFRNDLALRYHEDTEHPGIETPRDYRLRHQPAQFQSFGPHGDRRVSGEGTVSERGERGKGRKRQRSDDMSDEEPSMNKRKRKHQEGQQAPPRYSNAEEAPIPTNSALSDATSRKSGGRELDGESYRCSNCGYTERHRPVMGRCLACNSYLRRKGKERPEERWIYTGTRTRSRITAPSGAPSEVEQALIDTTSVVDEHTEKPRRKKRRKDQDRKYLCERLVEGGHICKKAFDTLAALKAHHDTAHSDPKPFSCPKSLINGEKCPKCFADEKSLKKHKATEPHQSSGDDGWWHCCISEHCTESFPTKHQWEEHMRREHPVGHICRYTLDVGGDQCLREFPTRAQKEQHWDAGTGHQNSRGWRRAGPGLSVLARTESQDTIDGESQADTLNSYEPSETVAMSFTSHRHFTNQTTQPGPSRLASMIQNPDTSGSMMRTPATLGSRTQGIMSQVTMGQVGQSSMGQGDDGWSCLINEMCKEVFRTKHFLKVHIQKVHGNQHICVRTLDAGSHDLCCQIFSTEAELEAHWDSGIGHQGSRYWRDRENTASAPSAPAPSAPASYSARLRNPSPQFPGPLRSALGSISGYQQRVPSSAQNPAPPRFTDRNPAPQFPGPSRSASGSISGYQQRVPSSAQNPAPPRFTDRNPAPQFPGPSRSASGSISGYQQRVPSSAQNPAPPRFTDRNPASGISTQPVSSRSEYYSQLALTTEKHRQERLQRERRERQQTSGQRRQRQERDPYLQEALFQSFHSRDSLERLEPQQREPQSFQSLPDVDMLANTYDPSHGTNTNKHMISQMPQRMAVTELHTEQANGNAQRSNQGSRSVGVIDLTESDDEKTEVIDLTGPDDERMEETG